MSNTNTIGPMIAPARAPDERLPLPDPAFDVAELAADSDDIKDNISWSVGPNATCISGAMIVPDVIVVLIDDVTLTGRVEIAAIVDVIVVVPVGPGLMTE